MEMIVRRVSLYPSFYNQIIYELDNAYIYADMTHLLRYIFGRFIRGISTLKANDELVVLEVINCKSENKEN